MRVNVAPPGAPPVWRDGLMAKMLPDARGITTTGELTSEQTIEILRHGLLDAVLGRTDAGIWDYMLTPDGTLWRDLPPPLDPAALLATTIDPRLTDNLGMRYWIEDPRVLGHVHPHHVDELVGWIGHFGVVALGQFFTPALKQFLPIGGHSRILGRLFLRKVAVVDWFLNLVESQVQKHLTDVAVEEFVLPNLPAWEEWYALRKLVSGEPKYFLRWTYHQLEAVPGLDPFTGIGFGAQGGGEEGGH